MQVSERVESCLFPPQHPLKEAGTLKVEVWGLTAVQTSAGAGGRPPHPPELTALTVAGWEGPKNLHPARKGRKKSLQVSQIHKAGKLGEADSGRESEIWRGEGRDPESQDSLQHVPAKLHIFVVCFNI